MFKASVHEINLSSYINGEIQRIIKSNLAREESWYSDLNVSNILDSMISDNGQFSFRKKEIKKIAKLKIEKIDNYIWKHDLGDKPEAILSYLRKYFYY